MSTPAFYEDNSLVIEITSPTQADIDRGAFDPWQRFELAFQIVVTDGWPYLLDDEWEISFEIDGNDLQTIYDLYGARLLTRPSCTCFNESCLNMPDNVRQVVTAELLIPSHRTLHNGYCVNETEPWIFSADRKSNITVTTTKLSHVTC